MVYERSRYALCYQNYALFNTQNISVVNAVDIFLGKELTK